MQKELRSFLPVLKLCDHSKVERYAAASFEKFLHNLENGIMERHPMNAANFFSQSSRLSNASDPCHEINFNDLGDLNTIASECFGFGDDFDLDLCGVELS